jgi:hypothetical protein
MCTWRCIQCNQSQVTEVLEKAHMRCCSIKHVASCAERKIGTPPNRCVVARWCARFSARPFRPPLARDRLLLRG